MTTDHNSEKFYHGTKANLKQGDLIEPGFNSNYGQKKKAKYIYFTATMDAFCLCWIFSRTRVSCGPKN